LHLGKSVLRVTGANPQRTFEKLPLGKGKTCR
jgi:hypothetical protein